MQLTDDEFPRLQPRLSVDVHMGEFYHWLLRLPPEVRARELLTVSRLGYGMVIAAGRLSGLPLVEASATASAGAPGAVTPAGAPEGASSVVVKADSQDDLMDEAVEQLLEVLPLEALAGPPGH